MRALPIGVVVVFVASTMAGCFGDPEEAAGDFVSGSKYGRLLIEVDYVEGFKPRTEAVNLLKQRATERLSKPDGVSMTEHAISSSDTSYSNNDLLELEKDERDEHAGGNTIVLYVLYLNGHHADDSDEGKVLGVQYGETSIAIFKDTVDSSGGLLGLKFNTADIEKAVLVHEFGHAIGLVNNGLEMVNDHEDGEHPRHSQNRNSVMYWAVENTFGLPGLDRIPNDFDEDDKADIRNGGGK